MSDDPSMFSPLEQAMYESLASAKAAATVSPAMHELAADELWMRLARVLGTSLSRRDDLPVPAIEAAVLMGAALALNAQTIQARRMATLTPEDIIHAPAPYPEGDDGGDPGGP